MVANDDSITLVVRRVRPVNAREVVEGKQLLPIPGQTGGRLRVLVGVALEPVAEGALPARSAWTEGARSVGGVGTIPIIPGTTRDLLFANVELDGVPVRLTDTAGLREGADPAIGVARAHKTVAKADLVVLSAHESVDGGNWSDGEARNSLGD